MSVFSERAMQYARDSLKAYTSFRQEAQKVVSQLRSRDITKIYLEGNDEIMDIMRLTCLELGMEISDCHCNVDVKSDGQGYRIIFS